jgi:hypothetical protein
MFYFLLGVLLGCTPDKESTGDSVDSSIEAEESPIYWDECSYRIGEHICNVSLPDSNMDEFALYEHYGRPVVIQLAAEWCAPCHVAGSFAEAIMDQWVAEDLLWVTILMENTDRENPNAQDLAEWTAEMGTINSVVLAGNGNLIDPAGERGFPLTSWPTFAIVNSDMLVYHGFAGWSEDYLNQKIAEMLFNGG